MTQPARCGSAAVAVALSVLLTLDAQLMVVHSWWALRYVSHPAPAGLFLFRLDDSVEHGNLVFQRGDAGADIAGQSCVSSENGEGEGGVVFWFCSGYSFMAIGIAPFGKLQQGVVEVVLHCCSPASGTSGGVCFSCCHLPLGHVHPADPGSGLCPVAISFVLCPALGFEP